MKRNNPPPKPAPKLRRAPSLEDLARQQEANERLLKLNSWTELPNNPPPAGVAASVSVPPTLSPVPPAPAPEQVLQPVQAPAPAPAQVVESVPNPAPAELPAPTRAIAEPVAAAVVPEVAKVLVQPAAQAAPADESPAPTRVVKKVPWADDGQDGVVSFNFKLPRALAVRLRYLGDTTYGASMTSIVVDAVTPVVAQMLKERGLE